jgi:hypothetical protein
MLTTNILVIIPWGNTKSIGRGINKQLVKTDKACIKALIWWNANYEKGFTALNIWWM